MSRGIDFKQKQVVNIKTGSIVGCVTDINADFSAGEIRSLIVSPINKMSIFKEKNNVVIPWNKIIKIGEDIILVEI